MKMNKTDEIKFRPIGIIHSPFKEAKGVPIQPSAAKGIEGKVEIFPEYRYFQSIPKVLKTLAIFPISF